MSWVPAPFSGGVLWQDEPSVATALSAANLNLDEQLEAAYAVALTQSAVNYFEGGQSASVPIVHPGSGVNLPVFYVAAPSGDTSGATDATAISAAMTALRVFANGNGILQFGPGQYYDNTARDYHATVGIIWQGAGGNSAGAAPGTEVSYTGTAARYLDARSSTGFQIRDMMIRANNASFTGNLIDLSHDGVGNTDASDWTIRDNVLSIAATTGTAVYLDDAICGRVHDNHIGGGAFGIQGVAVTGHYSNGIAVTGNTFANQTTACISGPGQGWDISGGNTFELQNGNAAIVQAFGAQSGGRVSGNWFGDVVGSPTIIQAGTGTEISGNYIGGNAGTTAISIPAGVAGTVVKGNTFDHHSVGIAIASSAADFDILPNFFSTVATKYTAPTVAVGAAAGSGASAVVTAGSDQGGKITVTCGGSGTTTGVIATVTFAGTHNAPGVVISPASTSAQAAGAYVSSLTTTTFAIAVATAPGAGTTPVFFWRLVEQ